MSQQPSKQPPPGVSDTVAAAFGMNRNDGAIQEDMPEMR
jgi:hypothetical protein